jgi:hypothetical protein
LCPFLSLLSLFSCLPFTFVLLFLCLATSLSVAIVNGRPRFHSHTHGRLGSGDQRVSATRSSGGLGTSGDFTYFKMSL